MSVLKGPKRLAFLAIIALFLLAGRIQAQVPVAIAPSVHPQFLDANGKPLSGGFIFTYSSGTTTRQDTYTDSTGSIINVWPIPLDATGSPSNLTTQTGIWLSNQSYKFCAQNSSLVQQWCVDNVSAYQILNNIQNIVFGSVTSDPTGTAGMIGYRSDIPCLRIFTTFWDCAVRLTDVQTLTNKTLTSPVLTTPTLTNPTVGGVLCPQPATCISVANQSPNGTINNDLAKLTGSPITAVFTATTDTGGAVGIVISGQGTSGNAIIQQSGVANCNFDGATTAGDYVIISSTTGGFCHDSGSSYPSPQVIGRVLSTSAFNPTGGLPVDLNPEIRGLSSGISEATLSGFQAISGNGTVCAGAILTCNTYVLANSHTAIRVVTNLNIAPVGCSTNATFGLRDITANSTVVSVTPTSTGITDSGPLAVSMPPGHQYGVGLTGVSGGCSTQANGSVTVNYQ